MKKLNLLLSLILLLILVDSKAGLPVNWKEVPNPGGGKINSRAACVASNSSIEQNINNVRARLLGGGDVWWDGKTIAKYVVPKVPAGQPEVSSIYAGAVWIGGKDDANNIKLAAMTYRSSGTDFWPGPLDPTDGSTNDTMCSHWDHHWRVLSSNIDLHLKNYQIATKLNQSYNCDKIPLDVKSWPAKGNPYFFELNKFELPTTSQGLAPFFDRNGDDLYDPCDGDYPIIEIRDCENNIYPSNGEMIYWIYNDAGNVHSHSKGSEAIHMEVQVQAFAYATADELNNMTFQRYKLINRATGLIRDCYFAMWLDPDLGCASDDYIGCDTTRSLMYVYNQDAQDGSTGCNCGSTPTYCDKIPMLGCDYFRGPLIINIDSIGNPIDTIKSGRMTSFTYYINGGGIVGPPGSDPSSSNEYYNYITGRWKDGTRLTYGGLGYNPSSSNFVNYAFIDEPCDNKGWSMASTSFPGQDFRTLQATGPLTLLPGQVNELIIGLPWVPDVQYPKPCIEQLQQADDIAQGLFDNCFKLPVGPDAPDLDFIELNNELVMIMTNDSVVSNNAFEAYKEPVLGAPKTASDTLYRFEGYRVYQLASSSVGYSPTELADPDKARIVVQVDVKNKVKEIYNWSAIKDPISGEFIWIPEQKTLGKAKDEGTRHIFQFTEDQFAQNDKRLINNKKYYYMAIAYGYNSYAPFDSKSGVGQKAPFIQGIRNVKTYAPIPRPIVDRTLKASYNEGIEITRLDGTGTGNGFLDISDSMRDKILSGTNENKITYLPGKGPFELKVFNPLDIKDGEFELAIIDKNVSDTILDTKSAYWRLIRLNSKDTVLSEGTIEKFNEQVIAKYGFSIAMGQVDEPGSQVFEDKTNGAIGGTTTYLDANKAEWLNANVDGSIKIGTQTVGGAQFKSIANQDALDVDINLDPSRGLSKLGPFQPYGLCDYRGRVTQGSNIPYITPGWMLESTFGPVSRGVMSNLNNVDIVFTSDKSKWSRCVVVETANVFYTNKKNASNALTNFYLGLETEKNPDGKVPLQFDLRGKYSVGKNDGNSDGLPDEDNLTDPVTGKRLYGMGWFPGYAIDVESGQRLNIFFGENSCYRPEIPIGDPLLKNGSDMLWNPNSSIFDNLAGNNAYGQYFGGQHYIYVSRTPYDECENLRKVLSGTNKSLKAVQLKNITWTCMPITNPNTAMLPLGNGASGLIPNDAIVKMRVANSYLVEKGTGANNFYPTYIFSIKDKEAQPLVSATINSALDLINVVPNPYYGFSAYENTQFQNIIKITNLPAKCKVTIYSLDGQFIKQYTRNEVGESNAARSNAPLSSKQITPALEWDLKNSKGIPVSSGVYIIHITADGLGERVIKWFGVARQFDPSGL